MAKKTTRKPSTKKYLDFHGRMVMVGFGSIGQGVLPLILRHIGIKPEQITIITDDMRGGEDEAWVRMSAHDANSGREWR